LARQCHFVVTPDGQGNWKVSSTEHWLQQRESEHIGGFWRDNSIGICLIGDFSRRAPMRGQLDCLVELTNSLQEVCKVSADRVYLHSDLDARSPSPGAAFPAAAFSDRLLRPQE
jgi:hypothetical protein